MARSKWTSFIPVTTPRVGSAARRLASSRSTWHTCESTIWRSVSQRHVHAAVRKFSSVRCQQAGGDDRSKGGDKYVFQDAAADDIKVTISPPIANAEPLKSFTALRSRLSERLYANIARLRFKQPSPIQANALPLLLQGRDVMACAQTGSGKTLMFLIAAIERLLRSTTAGSRSRAGSDVVAAPSVLVLAPTRELALQINGWVERLCSGTRLRSVCVFGGEPTRKQSAQLRSGGDVVIATPGRLQMFIDQGVVHLRAVEFLVVDEADRMLDMGFEPQLRYIVQRLSEPRQRVNLMCSATFPEDIQYLAANFLNEDYVFISVGRVGSTTERIRQTLAWVEEADKPRALQELLRSRQGRDQRTLVFVNTKVDAQKISEQLQRKGFSIAEIHGDRSQGQRQTALERFKRGRAQILVATDVAARGLDVEGVDHVVQYDTAKDIDGYTHRIGRTGRAGARGTSTAFMNTKQRALAPALKKQLEEVQQHVPTWLLGMANVAQKELEIRVNKPTSEDGGAADASGGGAGEDFDAQDFRRSAKRGMWGSQKDKRFVDFESKAYASDRESSSESSDFDEDAHSGGDSNRQRKDDADPQELDDGDWSPDLGGDSASSGESKEEVSERFVRPPVSEALDAWLDNKNFTLGERPDQRVERMLKRDQRLHYEYLGLFPYDLLQTSRTRFQEAMEGLPKVLMVAEKPSVAEAIARHLSNNRYSRRNGVGRNLPVYEFASDFPPTGKKSLINVTSVVGHIFTLAFADEAPAGGKDRPTRRYRSPGEFFHAATVKKVEDSTDKLRVVEHLQNEAVNASHLALWLDCDREGENIAYEVISVTRESFPDDKSIYRARFSALTTTDLQRAFSALVRPDRNASMAVDARQELDLKVGVAFTRLLTSRHVRAVRERFSGDCRLLSYGPCQTPTLYFCVQRFREIEAFKRETYFKVRARVQTPNGYEIWLRWAKRRTFDESEARALELRLKSRDAARRARVSSVTVTERRQSAPHALNTVQLLMACSKALGLSPKKAMNVAEKLYSAGFVSYPRTETSAYHPSFDVKAVLLEHRSHPDWGPTAQHLLRTQPKPPKGGVEVGDHPPVTPTRVATRGEVGGALEWRVYDYITRHFLGSLMGDMLVKEVHSTVNIGDVEMEHCQTLITEIGFGAAMPWMLRSAKKPSEEYSVDSDDEEDSSPKVGANGRPRRVTDESQKLHRNDALRVLQVRLERAQTKAPELLQEHELVSLMDKHGIGTDASMAQHISTVVDRQYVVICDKAGQPIVQSRFGAPQQKSGGGRYMLPTPLGVGVVDGFTTVNDQLVLPDIRALMEREVIKIADGELDRDDVVSKNLQWFQSKFSEVERSAGLFNETLRARLRPTAAHLREHRAEWFAAAADSASAGTPRTKRTDSSKTRRGDAQTKRKPQQRSGGNGRQTFRRRTGNR